MAATRRCNLQSIRKEAFTKTAAVLPCCLARLSAFLAFVNCCFRLLRMRPERAGQRIPAVMMVSKNSSLMPSPIQPPLVSPAFDSYLLEVADAVNTTLDLNTLLQRVAEMLKRFIDYEIFAILLLNEKTQELRVRFQVGHPPEVAERIRIKVGQGVTGRAVQTRQPVLVNDRCCRRQRHQHHARRALRAGGAAHRQEQSHRRDRRRSRRSRARSPKSTNVC